MECILWSKKQDNKRMIHIYKKWLDLLENNQISEAYKNQEILQLVKESDTEIRSPIGQNPVTMLKSYK